MSFIFVKVKHRGREALSKRNIPLFSVSNLSHIPPKNVGIYCQVEIVTPNLKITSQVSPSQTVVVPFLHRTNPYGSRRSLERDQPFLPPRTFLYCF